MVCGTTAQRLCPSPCRPRCSRTQAGLPVHTFEEELQLPLQQVVQLAGSRSAVPALHAGNHSAGWAAAGGRFSTSSPLEEGSWPH